MRKMATVLGLLALTSLTTLALPATASAADPAATARISNGVLRFTAAPGQVNDLSAWESIIQGGIVFDDRVNINPGNGCWDHPSDSSAVVCDDPAGPGYRVEIVMGDRSDTAVIDIAYGARIEGGTGHDELVGFSADRILGQSGNDWLYGGDGYNFGDDDVHYGGSGDDYVEQGDFNYGGSGNDTVVPAWGRYAYGDDGRDRLIGTNGNDRLYGGTGNDDIDAYGGSDIVYGKDGADDITGGAGSDDLYGGHHNDEIFGNSGNDLVIGGPGSDRLSGGPGSDTIRQS